MTESLSSDSSMHNNVESSWPHYLSLTMSPLPQSNAKYFKNEDVANSPRPLPVVVFKFSWSGFLQRHSRFDWIGLCQLDNARLPHHALERGTVDWFVAI